MADDRLPCCRSESMAATSSDKVMFRPRAISFNPFQNASSRLTLVLWPAAMIERLATRDLITIPHVNYGHSAVSIFLSCGHAGFGGLRPAGIMPNPTYDAVPSLRGHL